MRYFLRIVNVNIDVILLALAIICLSIAGFLYSAMAGFIVLGLLLLLSAFLVTPFIPTERGD